MEFTGTTHNTSHRPGKRRKNLRHKNDQPGAARGNERLRVNTSHTLTDARARSRALYDSEIIIHH